MWNSLITTKVRARSVKGEDMVREVYPVSPGELLEEEFLKPLGLTKYALAKAIHVPPSRVGEIVSGKRAITADTDLRLCRFFGLSNGYWLRAQNAYDEERLLDLLDEELSEICPYSHTV